MRALHEADKLVPCVPSTATCPWPLQLFIHILHIIAVSAGAELMRALHEADKLGPLRAKYRDLPLPREPGSYVGLVNAGATCYMNAVLQQLFMQPSIRDALLAIEDGQGEDDCRDCLFSQIQVR